ncbi:phage tail protein [Pseudoalteromonas rubra]|uniref:Phage tail protein n=1 Tax=Pseudoalteromonas rubra TaxID=43658 RepID=A0A4Q7EJ55_9GAMM|nr:phage tail protein [Pseudoalteromonas rubra]RZM83798.1 phage tail protein [Pseudoalteromonas rubra]
MSENLTPNSPLVPPNHTKLQWALDQHGQLTQTLETGISLLRGFKSHPNPNLLPWLVWEYGLDPLEPYLDNLDEVLLQGLSWQRIRGTRASLAMAVGWLGVPLLQIEESDSLRHFYRYQLHLDSVPGEWQLNRLAQLSELSAPARSQLVRITYQLDIRELALSSGQFGDLLSDQSGFRYTLQDGQQVRLSRLRAHSEGTEVSVQSEGGVLRKRGQLWGQVHDVRLGSLVLSEPPASHLLAGISHQRNIASHIHTQPGLWQGSWSTVSWSHNQTPQLVQCHYSLT